MAERLLSHLQTTPICITVAVAKLKFVALQTLLDHRCLQSCVGTRARFGYATFDAQLRKVYFVITVHLCVRKHAYAI